MVGIDPVHHRFGIIYWLTWAGHFTSGDGAQKVAWAKAMLFSHTASISTTGDIQFSKYSVGHSLIAMPGFALGALSRYRTSE
jgi:hypothetical protein